MRRWQGGDVSISHIVPKVCWGEREWVRVGSSGLVLQPTTRPKDSVCQVPSPNISGKSFQGQDPRRFERVKDEEVHLRALFGGRPPDFHWRKVGAPLAVHKEWPRGHIHPQQL